LLIAVLGTIALAAASQARAENTLISPEEAEALVRAQVEEQKAAAAALKEAEAAQAAEMAKAAKTAKSVRASKIADKKIKEAGSAPVKAVAEKTVEESDVEATASLPAGLQVLPRSEGADAAKATSFKPLIARYASENGLPYELADAVVRLESRYNPGARRGANVGLTQVNFQTAQSLGYKGELAGLLDAETNLRFGLKYLAVAYKLAGGDTCGAILRYQFGLRTSTMSGASRAYCAKVKVLAAAAE